MTIIRRLRRWLTLRALGDALLVAGLIGLAVGAVLGLIELGGGRSLFAEGIVIGTSEPPLIQFTPKMGDPIEFSYGTDTTFWNAGDHVPVAYNPQDPRDARIDGLPGRWFAPFVLAACGIACLVAGAILTLTVRVLPKLKPKPPPQRRLWGE